VDLSVFFAGTGGSVPTARRGLPALLVRRGGDRLLFDCGEGTQRQLLQTVGLPEIDAVFITHFHADHWLGLPGMLKTFDLRGRETGLTVYGPRGLRELLTTMRPVYGRVSYGLELVELDPNDEVRRDGYVVGCFEVAHRGRSLGYALVEPERPGEFDPQEAQRLGVRPGPDFGRLQDGEEVDGVRPEQVLGPPRPGRKLVISGDTAPSPMVVAAAHGADLLVHEATFTEEERDRARETGHSTAPQAAEIAREAGVKMLALTHVSTRHLPSDIRREAQAIFEPTVLPRDYDTIELPFPERGAPELVRWHPESRPPPDNEQLAAESERPPS
jgi:ribonuclease Z